MLATLTLAFSPLIDLGSPTKLGFEIDWVLTTLANLIVFILLLLVFIVGVTVRLPGARRDIANVEAHDHAGDDA